MQDMRFTHNKTVTKRSVHLTQKALKINKKVSVPLKVITHAKNAAKNVSKSVKSVVKSVKSVAKSVAKSVTKSVKRNAIEPVRKVISPALRAQVVGKSRVCTASGDPHFTNFNGEYFHLQEPSIFIFARSKDALFEVQVKQDGASRVGDPSYVRATKIRYGSDVYTSSFSKDGFSVQQSGTTLTVTAPASYEGQMMGICGEDTPFQGNHNFRTPDGNIADVNYGQRGWEMGGYGGPNTKLSRWHLAWKPSLNQCLFSANECKTNLGMPVPVVKKAAHARRRG
jgi:hypothetical protein